MYHLKKTVSIIIVTAATLSCAATTNEYHYTIEPIVRTMQELMTTPPQTSGQKLLTRGLTRRNHHLNARKNMTNTHQEAATTSVASKSKAKAKAPKTRKGTSAQTIGINITAATVGNVQDPLVIPPNLNGWVGPQQYILMTYNIMRSFDKTTGQPDGMLNIDADSFFGVQSNDVRIDYDRFSQRWFFSCEGINPTTGLSSALVLVVSSSAIIDTNTTWTTYVFSNAQMIPQLRPQGSGALDYQQLAIDQNSVYIAVDAFDRNGDFYNTSALVIQKSSINANALVAKVFTGIAPGSNANLVSGFTPPADNFDTNPTFGYLVNATNLQYPSGNTYTQLYLYRINNPGSTNPTVGHMVTIPVPAYTDPANAPYAGNLFGSSAFLQTSFAKLNAPHVRNHQLFVCHNIQVDITGAGNPSGDRVGTRWYQFDLTGDSTGQGGGTETTTTLPALVQWGTLHDSASTSNPLFYFNPSIMTNKNGDMVIGCTISGATASPNAAYAGRAAADPLGTLRTPVLVTSSSFSYNYGPFVNSSDGNIGQRWGDLSSMSPDPVDDLDIWSTQEFAAVQNGWGVQVTQLIPAV